MSEKENLKVGMKASFTKIASDEVVQKLAEVSGDNNPVHLVDDYAAQSIFGKRIAHGLFCVGLVSNVLGNQLPGHGTILLNENINYCKPVYIDDEITATVEIVKVSERKMELSYLCINQRGIEVMNGTALVKVL